MKQTTAPKTPSPNSYNPRGEFFAAAMNMSWQLAIVVLVPIIGGFELDEKLNTLPALTIVGFFMAMTGMAFVVWRQMQLFSPPPSHNNKGPRL